MLQYVFLAQSLFVHVDEDAAVTCAVVTFPSGCFHQQLSQVFRILSL